MLETEVEIGVDDGRTFDGAVGVCGRVGEIEKTDFGDGEIGVVGVDAEEFARVVGVRA